MHGNLQSSPSETSAGTAVWIDQLVEQAWRKLAGICPQERIREIATDAAARYANATVTAFIPILVERLVRERLRSEHGKTARRGEPPARAGPAHSFDVELPPAPAGARDGVAPLAAELFRRNRASPP